MPFTFVEIERKKTTIIGPLATGLVLFYFLTGYLVVTAFLNSTRGIFAGGVRVGALLLPSFFLTMLVLAGSYVVGSLHWYFSTRDLIPRMIRAVRACPADRQDDYHAFFLNIVSEVSIATGGRFFEAVVIPCPSMNAFSLEDLNGRAVIGVTEGLLARLSRSQIEAVVAHEAGHIVSGDCVETTLTSALAEIYEEIFERLAGSLRDSDRPGFPLVAVTAVIGLMNCLSSLLRSFVSRQREYRADALSVRMTRDPQSLAEALKLVSRNWRGAGTSGDRLQSIFIANPRYSDTDEREGFFPDLFSTHPPVRMRVDLLLDMAHLSAAELEEKIRNVQRVSPVPMTCEQECPAVSQSSRTSAARTVASGQPVSERPDLSGQQRACPVCGHQLHPQQYEGAPVLRCERCAGTLVEEDVIKRILVRQDLQYSQATLRLGQTMVEQRRNFTRLQHPAQHQAWVLTCPRCAQSMHRQYYVYSYPILIDRCIGCAAVWFDRQELELLQYLFEHKELFFSP